ncbi:unnamed protein product [Urochloa decumbens]|uniref:MPN domain-containing protein n=1 Tax=Urochloa decumbens TaxID=240449 RepID=A0ABC8Z802_9POAL
MDTGPPRRARGDVSIESLSRPVAVDHRISIQHYFRIADNLRRQADVYREENNLLDLYIILLRYSSLLIETIPKHHDYNSFRAREKEFLKKGPHNSQKLRNVVNELESLKPVVHQQFANHNSEGAEEPNGLHGTGTEQYIPSPYMPKSLAGSPTGLQQKLLSSSKHQAAPLQNVQPERQLIKQYSTLPYPKEETLSRHSILGPNGLHGQWAGPVTGIRIEYPRNPELTQTDISSLVPSISNQDSLHGPITVSQDKNDDMLSVLSLDDGRWSLPVEELASVPTGLEAEFSQLNIRQPSPPPVLAQVHSESGPIPPSKVADPRPGLATSDTGRYQNLHVCQATNEEEIFEVQDKASLLSLGWIHTHPTQTCFLSSIDLHNHYAYQIMLPEAIAIVMAPTDTTRKHGIFHLTDPCGMGVIHDCDATGFHPHEEPLDGTPIYEHCSHVYMNPNVKFEMVDLREV